MKANDHNLGMDRHITHRDFVNGIVIGVAGALALPRWAQAQERAPEQTPDYYRVRLAQ